MKKSSIILIIAMIIFSKANAQGVGINTVGLPANSNSMLDVTSNDKGVFIPRMTSAQRNAIAVAGGNDVGLLVYDRDKRRLYMYDGTTWIPFAYEKPGFEVNSVESANVTTGANMGCSSDIDGDYAVIGAKYDDVGSNNQQGSAQVYRNISGIWTQMAELTANDGATGDRFGSSVAISGNYIAVATTEANSFHGAVYIFFHSGNSWIQQAKINNPPGDSFAENVDLDGNTLIVSAYTAKIGNNNSQGAVFVYTRSGTSWSQQIKLTASDGGAGDQLGFSIALDGNYIVAGAPNAIGHLNNAHYGAAYVFFNNAGVWSQQAKIYHGVQTVSFGKAVSISQDRIAVSCNELVSVFSRSGIVWTAIDFVYPPARDFAPGPYPIYEFGNTVKINTNYLLVGSMTENVNGMAEAGTVYVFKKNGAYSYVRCKRLTDNEPMYGDHFGYSIGLSDTYFVIGSPGFSPAGTYYLDGQTGKISFGSISQ